MPHQYEDIEIGPEGEGLDANTRLLGTLVHLSCFLSLLIASPLFLSPIGPLIFWLTTRNNHPFLDDQGKEALNFQISILIYATVCAVICLPLFIILIGIPLLILLETIVGIFWVACSIVAAVRANSGEWYRYPLTIRLVQ